MRLSGPWFMKAGALAPPYRATLRRPDRQPLDLSMVDHVHFVMRQRRAGAALVDAPAEILQQNGTNVGVCEYDWQPGDTDLTGIFRGEFALYDENHELIATIPNDSYQEIQILGNLSEVYDAGELTGWVPGPRGPRGPEGPPGVPGAGYEDYEALLTRIEVLEAAIRNSGSVGERLIPPGGGSGELLGKASGEDFDADWRAGLPAGGSAGQVLSRDASNQPAWMAPMLGGMTYVSLPSNTNEANLLQYTAQVNEVVQSYGYFIDVPATAPTGSFFAVVNQASGGTGANLYTMRVRPPGGLSTLRVVRAGQVHTNTNPLIIPNSSACLFVRGNHWYAIGDSISQLPTSATRATGSMYYDESTNTIKWWNGTVWREIT